MIEGRVLITGGTGSLGTAILERAEREGWDTQFTVLARSETKMTKVRQRFPHITPIIGDVRDRDKLTTVFPGHDLVIHAAAIKIVPVAESDPSEAVKTNVLGSMNVAQAAIESGVKKVVGISTDKACGPTYYGITKRLMEGIFRQANEWGDTVFSLCRYGNVLRSANSIVPLFEKQNSGDGPFTITDGEMVRFWLSMKQAVDIVVQTANDIPAGCIFIPAAPAMSIVDLAKTINPDREIEYIGIRPGERLHETLVVEEEAMHTKRVNELAYFEGGGFVVYPPTVQVPKEEQLPFQFSYNTNNPDHYLSHDEMRSLLDQSPESVL